MDPAVPIFWMAKHGLALNLSQIVWIHTNQDGSAIIGMSVALPDGGHQIKIDKGKELNELLAIINTRTDRRESAE